MVYTTIHPDAQDLSESFADFLQYDSVFNLNEAFSLMGRRFKGKPRKAQIAKGIAKYVKEHPQEVLRKCNADTLMYIHKMIEMGKGSCITLGKPMVRGHQIQQMDLVLTYDDGHNNQTELYLLDELHDIFAPHIEEAYKNPSPVLHADMLKGLESLKDMAQSCKTPEEFIAKLKEQYPGMDLSEESEDEKNEEIDALLAEAEKKPKLRIGTKDLPYPYSDPLMKDIRDLHYKGQAAVCKTFHRILQQGEPKISSRFIERFDEDYVDMSYDDLEESIDALHHCINDMDSIIYDVDMYNPMSFFELAARLYPVISLSQEKWPTPVSLGI